MKKRGRPKEWDEPRRAFTTYFSEDQERFLRQLAHDKRTSMTAILRDLVDQLRNDAVLKRY
jgi:hypothetical protein